MSRKALLINRISAMLDPMRPSPDPERFGLHKLSNAQLERLRDALLRRMGVPEDRD